MPEETVTAVPESTDVPAVAEGSATDTTGASEAVTPVESGEVSTPESTEESFTKFDPKTLSTEGLRAYKKLQADYTRARQADKARTQQLEEQIRSYQPLLSDKDVQAKAYYLQYGKYPEGYQPMFGQAKPEVPQEPQFNVDEMTPIERKLYEDNQKLLQESQYSQQERQAQMVKNTNEGVKNFYEKLVPEHKKLWQENIKDIQESATLYASKGMPVDVALRKAFNSACTDKLVELAKLEAMNAMKKKATVVRPESGVNVQGEIVQGDYKTPQEAVKAAIDSLKR